MKLWYANFWIIENSSFFYFQREFQDTKERKVVNLNFPEKNIKKTEFKKKVKKKNSDLKKVIEKNNSE